jgi:NAD(P)H-hydrate epimerase
MRRLPDSIYSVAGVREIDRTAIEDAGIPGYALMTRAGEAAVQAIRRHYPDAVRWQIVCGAGNNAGDGYVVARLAAQDGMTVSVASVADPDALRGDAARACGDFLAGGGVARQWPAALDADADVVVDALLGSGLERDVAGAYAAAVEAINAHRGAVVALDIPTGLNGDTGAVMGTAVRADLTVTFVGLKTGLFLDAGPECCGELVYAGLGIEDALRAGVAVELRRIGLRGLSRRLPRRRRSAHKGHFGHVLVVGGGAGMPGAVRLCGEAALRTGAGLVSVATHPAHAGMLVASRPELMSHGVTSVAELEVLLGKATVVAFGPGLGRSPWAGELFERLAADPRPAVWDADALHWLAGQPGVAAGRIITPHPGEAGALLDLAAGDVQHDRRAALTALRQRYGGVVVLKGAGSLVSSDSGPPWICTAGNPGMASAGMGDVLTGVIAGLLAQGLDPESAAALGVAVHARAGDRAARQGERGLLASDLLAELRGVVNA